MLLEGVGSLQILLHADGLEDKSDDGVIACQELKSVFVLVNWKHDAVLLYMRFNVSALT